MSFWPLFLVRKSVIASMTMTTKPHSAVCWRAPNTLDSAGTALPLPLPLSALRFQALPESSIRVSNPVSTSVKPCLAL